MNLNSGYEIMPSKGESINSDRIADRKGIIVTYFRHDIKAVYHLWASNIPS